MITLSNLFITCVLFTGGDQFFLIPYLDMAVLGETLQKLVSTMKKTTLVLILTLVLFSTSTICHADTSKSKGTYEDTNFKTSKTPANIWNQIPFFPGGDIGQYEETMSQSRDSVRKMFWDELMSEVQKLADKGVVVEKMLEPMANILLKFDQLHDIHKAKDIINIDFSLENQFKSALDNLFTKFDVREAQRKIQISRGTNADLLTAYIRGISKDLPFGASISQQEIDVKKALEMFDQIDYISYGTFSSLGHGSFQLTFHLTGNKNGVTRNFIARGSLTDAVNQLAQQVFDFFQANVYGEWKAPYNQLEWLPMPINHERQRKIDEANDWDIYTFNEAKSYCKARGYRLPYAKELLMAETGTKYQEGGIAALYPYAKWAVADRRKTNENYWAIPGNAESTGGIFMGDSSTVKLKGVFWCVRGQPAADVVLADKIWSLIRRAQSNRDLDVYRALQTLRFEIGDDGAEARELIFWNGNFVDVKIYGSVEEALNVLNENGISIAWPN